MATVEAYAPGGKTWSPIADRCRQPASNFLAAASVQGRIYAVGGWDGFQPDGDGRGLPIQPPAPGRRHRPLPTAPIWLLAAVAVAGEGLLYALGGFKQRTIYLHHRGESSTPSTNAWSAGPPMPTWAGRSSPPRTGADGKIYAIGGQTETEVLATVEVFEPDHRLLGHRSSCRPSAGPWPLPRRRQRPASTPVRQGLDEVAAARSTAYTYNPETGGPWTATSSLLTDQAQLAGVTGPGGVVHAIGGQSHTTVALNVVETYTAADPRPRSPRPDTTRSRWRRSGLDERLPSSARLSEPTKWWSLSPGPRSCT